MAMANKNTKKNFVDDMVAILVRQGALQNSEAQAIKESFARSTSAQFDEFLLDEGLIEKPALLKALSEYYQMPAVDVVGEFFDHLLLTNFPKDFLLRNRVIPLEIDQDELVVVAAEPDMAGLEHAIRKFTENDIIFRVGIARDICDAVKEFYDVAPTEEIPEDLDIQEEHRQQREELSYEYHKDKISPLDEEE